MSLFALVTRTLIGTPQRRQGVKKEFITAALRIDDGTIISIIAFRDSAELLAGYGKGDAVAVSGPADFVVGRRRHPPARPLGHCRACPRPAERRKDQAPAQCSPLPAAEPQPRNFPIALYDDPLDNLWLETAAS